jgi:hypothetical protein
MPTYPVGSRARQNLELLANTFQPISNDTRLLRAGMFRELGLFYEASALLSAHFLANRASVVHWMQDRIAQREGQAGLFLKIN